MVPSWTETLLACGVNVVARTRFCVHPREQIQQIPAVGGTKDIQWDKVLALAPDLILLDQEENPKSMAQDSPIEVLATHIRSVRDVARELRRIAHRFGVSDASERLCALAERWERIVENEPRKQASGDDLPPGVIKWICRPQLRGLPPSRVWFDSQIPVVYVIWRNPWMAISHQTFIASMLEHVGISPKRLWPRSEALTAADEVVSPMDSNDSSRAAQKIQTTRRTPQDQQSQSNFLNKQNFIIKQDQLNKQVNASKQTQASEQAQSRNAIYPTFELEQIPAESLLLFSSEPFPFDRHLTELAALPYASALVDGESFSWFGIRSLHFLEKTFDP